MINNSRNETTDKIVRITDLTVLPVTIITPLTLFTVSRINNNSYDENSSILLTLSEITSTASTFLVKNIFKRKRPFQELKKVKHSIDDEKFLDSYSFPSGHTSLTFSFATSLTLRYSDKPVLVAGMYSYAFVVSLGRVYLGNHYPSDVLGGMLLGSGSAILIYSLRPEIISLKNNIFGEKNKPDANKSNYITPLFFGTFILSDIINNYFLSTDKNIKINFHSTGGNNYLNFNYGF
ncbi:MAG: phosphatase PAP2 family protein [Ignavibacteria bacterium]|nr:phosphatase PAP2 family protein [Ignavibacteria bacterium]